MTLTERNDKVKRVTYLDGLRGLACLVVVLDHYLYCYYPSTITGDPTIIHNHFELTLARTPLNVIYNGDLAVCVFFVLSGYVLSRPYFSAPDKLGFLSISALKRYPRLVIPMVVVSAIARWPKADGIACPKVAG